jgi:adenylate cyclase
LIPLGLSMSRDRLSGKLAVILHADVAGSTVLVRQNEQLAHERTQDTFHRFTKIISQYQGRVHELRGDALLAEFERASDAISAALTFQSTQREYNAKLDDNIKPQVRIGVALGEVIIADNTITGAGVVLAQRLEQMVEPGGVIIQGAAYETIPERFPFEYENLGEHQAKGFDDSIRVYQVRLSENHIIPPPQNTRPQATSSKSGNQFVVITAIILVTALATVFWIKPWRAQIEPAFVEGMALSLTDKPSIAVLPLINMSDDPEQEYFADGMAEDLITDLSKIPGLIVISRTSSFAYKGKSEDIRGIAKALNSRYVVEGSVRRANDKIRINLQLVDARTGHHVWAERYDNTVEEIFALQDLITEQLVKALDSQLETVDLAVVSKRPTIDLKAYDVFLQGSGIFQRFSKDDTFLARRYFEEAIGLDPGFARAYAMLAWTYVFEYTNGWATSPQTALQRGLDIANKSISLDKGSPVAHFVRGLVHRERKEFEEALADAKISIELDPSYANGHVLTATLLYYAGRPEEGLNMLDIASRLNPLHPSNYPFHRGQALFILKRYEEAIEAFKFGLSQNPSSQRLHVWLAATYAQIGLFEDAEWEASEILYVDPDFSPAHLDSIFPFRNREDLKIFNAALNKAGFRGLSNKFNN